MYIHNRIRICLIIMIVQSRKCSVTAPSKIDFSSTLLRSWVHHFTTVLRTQRAATTSTCGINPVDPCTYRLTLRPLLVSMVLVTTTPLASTVVACLQNINCKYLINAIQSCTKSMQLSFNGYTLPFSVGGCPASIKIIATVYVQRLSYNLL